MTTWNIYLCSLILFIYDTKSTGHDHMPFFYEKTFHINRFCYGLHKRLFATSFYSMFIFFFLVPLLSYLYEDNLLQKLQKLLLFSGIVEEKYLTINFSSWCYML